MDLIRFRTCVSDPPLHHQCPASRCLMPNLLRHLSAQTLCTHAFSVFRLVGLYRHPNSTVAPRITLLYAVGSGADQSKLLLTRPFSQSRTYAKTGHLDQGGCFCGYVCQLVPYVRKWIQKRHWRQIFPLDNVTLLLADVCPSNRKMLAAKKCVSQTQTPYRGELHASVNKAVSVPFLRRLWYVRD